MSSKCKSADDSSFGTVVKCGYLKKLKTSKKKYFVLRAEKYDTSACLEYYDSEKKFNSGQPPKRTIPLKTCFNINKRSDTKHKHVIALYTKDDCFCVILDTEDSLDAWLKALLSQQQGEEATDGQIPRPTFEHVWQVQVLQRGLGATPLWGIVSGQSNGFRLCLTDKTLSLIRTDSDKAQIELELSSVRSCGFLEKYFYLEAGRCSSIGVGELWMETEDANIARNVHQTVCHAMSSNKASREDIRPRANSDTDYAKNYPMKRREPAIPSNLPPLHQGVSDSRSNDLQTQQQQPFRQRTTSEGAPPAGNRYNRFQHHHITQFPTYITSTTFDRPQSYYVPAGDIPLSPPSGSPVSPSADCSTDSAESSLSIDDRDSWLDSEQTIHYPNHPPTPSDEAIPEENCDDGVDSPYDMHHTYGTLAPSDYMNIQPASSDDGGGGSSKLPNMSPATSNCSITSGTPSMEYPLEKVSSFLTQSEEDETSDRPTRTYSVGSRPSTLKYQSHVEPTLSASECRKRAFSVGSKTKKVLRNRLFPQHSTSTAHPSIKSSSAPILSTRNLDHQRDDLMEMDFTNRPPSNINNNNNNEYVHMEPPGSNKHATAAVTTTPSIYVITKSGHNESMAKVNRSRDDNSPYVDMKSGTSPAKPVYQQSSDSRHSSVNSRSSRGSGSTEYMEMGQYHHKPSTSPLVNCPPLSQYLPNNISRGTEYMDMSFTSNKSNKDRNSFSSNASTDQYSASPVKNSMSPMGSPPMDYVSMDYSHSRSGSDSKPNHHQQEGYVEMTLGRGSHHKRQSSVDSGRISYSDYAKMTPSGGGTGKERKNSGKRDKNRSAPIMIQNTSAQNQSAVMHDPSPGSPMLTGYPPMRKYSTGTPPLTNMHLPLSGGSSVNSTSYTSLPRQQSRSRKNSSRRESRDSSSSSVTTLSSSSTMFPINLNSPMSPIKSSDIKVPPAVLNAKYDVSSSAFGGSNRSDYTIMDFDRSVSIATTMVPSIATGSTTTRLSSTVVSNTATSAEDNSDYVNYNPAQNVLNQTTDHRRMNDESGDYAIMKPGVLSRLLSDTGTSAPLMPDASCCFRPIMDEVLLKSGVAATGTISASTDDISPSAQRAQSSVTFTTCRQNSDSGRPSSETRSMLSSRPSSTSSELSSSASTLVGGCSRPGSVNSDQLVTPATLHYAKLDLSAEGGCSDAAGSDTSPRSVKCSEGAGSVTDASQPTFTYAKIDFVKRENFKPQQQGSAGLVSQATAQPQQCSAKLKH